MSDLAFGQIVQVLRAADSSLGFFQGALFRVAALQALCDLFAATGCGVAQGAGRSQGDTGRRDGRRLLGLELALKLGSNVRIRPRARRQDRHRGRS